MNENDQVSCEIGKVVKVDRVRGNSKVSLWESPVTGVNCGIRYVIYSKVKFTTNITYVTGIHKYYFYNNRHTFTSTDTNFITKYTHFIKSDTVPDLIVAPKCVLSSKVDTFSKVVLSFGKVVLYLACVILVLNWFWPTRHLA